MISVLLFILAFLAAWTSAYPSRGHYPFAVALCNYVDRPSQPTTRDKVLRFMTSSGASTPGMYKYFREQSNGAVDFEGTIVGGWYTVPHTKAFIAGYNRWNKINACRDAAVAGGLVIPKTHKMMALYNELDDIGETGGEKGGVLLIADDSTKSLNVALAGHEVLHALGECHSRWRASPTSAPAEYGDQFDIMSNMAVNTPYDDGVYGPNGPNLAAPARDRMGWLPMNRIYTAPSGAWRLPLQLTTLSKDIGTTSGYVMARIPANTAIASYYTIELRTATGFDQGLTNPYLAPDSNGVVIHQVNETDVANWLFAPYFGNGITGRPFSWFYKPGDQLVNRFTGINITVISLDILAGIATIEISATGPSGGHVYSGPNACKAGLVWREGDQMDYACVSPARRSQVKNDNGLGASRKVSGSQNCQPGFVWREAWPGDYVCVTSAERTTAQLESRQAYLNVASDWTSKGIASGPYEPVVP